MKGILVLDRLFLPTQLWSSQIVTLCSPYFNENMIVDPAPSALLNFPMSFFFDEDNLGNKLSARDEVTNLGKTFAPGEWDVVRSFVVNIILLRIFCRDHCLTFDVSTTPMIRFAEEASIRSTTSVIGGSE